MSASNRKLTYAWFYYVCQAQFTLYDNYKYIIMAFPMFSGPRNSVMLSGRLDVGTGHDKFKMAAA
jgi:hypothetical protein